MCEDRNWRGGAGAAFACEILCAIAYGSARFPQAVPIILEVIEIESLLFNIHCI